MNASLYIFGILLQTIAALVALVQVREAPRKLPWLFIAVSSLIIVVRRVATLEQFMTANRELARGEILTLVVSLLFFLGVILMARMFKEVQNDRNALQESAERHKAILRTAMDGFVRIDMKGQLVETNRAFCEISGYTEAELLTMNLDGLEVEKKRTAERMQGIASGGNDRFETQLRRKNGSMIDAEISIQFKPIDGGQFVAFIRDITEFKQYDLALRHSEERFRTLTESAPEAIFVQRDGHFVYLNKATLNLFGASHQDEMLGKKFMERVAPDYQDIVNERIRLQLESGKSSPIMEQAYVRLDDSYVPVETTAVAIQFEGKAAHLVFARDITERKRVEEALHKSEIQYRMLVENAGEAIYIAQNGVVQFANSRTIELFGYSMEELRSKPFVDFIYPDDLELVLSRHVKRQQGMEVPSQYTFRVIHRSGAVMWVELNAVRVEWENKPAILNFLSDITDRKRSEETLRDSERRYRIVADNTYDWEFWIDQKGRFLYTSPSCLRITGYAPENFMADPDFFARIIHHEDRPLFEAHICATRKQQGPAEISFRIIRPDGTYRWIDHICQPIFDETGHFLGRRGSNRDITESKQAEAKRREAEEKFTKLFQSVPVLISLTDMKSGVYLDVNDEGLRVSGFEREELIGHTSTEIGWIDSEKRNMIKEDLISHGRITGREMEFHAKGGGTLTGLVSGELITIAGRNCFLSVVVDITERKNAEIAMMQSEEKYRGILENIEEGYFELDLAGNCTFVNDAQCRIVGYSQDELIGMNYRQYSEEATALKEYEAFSRLYLTGEPIKAFDGEYIRKDGTRGYNEFSASLIRDAEGNPLGFRCLSRDITERKQAEEKHRELEERLQRSEKMEALGLLAGGVAHDLNNTLGILVGYAELLYDDLEESDPKREDALSIIKGGEQAAAIVQDLLTLARRGVQTKTVLNINKIVDEYLNSPEFLKLKSLHPQVHVKTELAEELLVISGSRAHLCKTLMNLASNAAEAMAAGGDIFIRTENRYLDRPVPGYDELNEGDYVVLTVSDEGEGISGEEIKRIFEPFYTKKVMGRSGTGLGLSVVWGTVKDHGGYIDVQSRRGFGTLFHLYFPVMQGKERDGDSTTATEAYWGRGEKVLVVDDIENQRNLAKRILEKLSYTVETVASGEEAIAYLQENEVDIVILDMIMDPGMDGFETYRRLSEIRPRQKAIIVSGFAETERVKMAQDLGAGSFVRKPYIREHIGRAVRKELDRK